ncbi:MAG TPA: hypothetical protein VMH34_01335 [Gammaproteobacteria bacterium]|nr:hypothetical protein [Gammaproteobacteria bacterium]
MKKRNFVLMAILCGAVPFTAAQDVLVHQDINRSVINVEPYLSPGGGNWGDSGYRPDESSKLQQSGNNNPLLDYSPTESYTGSSDDSPMAKMYERDGR